MQRTDTTDRPASAVATTPLVGAVLALVLPRIRREDAVAAAAQQGGWRCPGSPEPEGTAVAVDVDGLAQALEAELRQQGVPERAAAEKAYLKSDLKFYGATVPQVRRTVKAFRARQPDIGHDDLVGLVQALWTRPVHECRSAAVMLLELYGERVEADDSVLIERMLREAGTWALVDDLAASVMGSLVERCPELGATLDRWAGDDDFWLRRSALLALLLALRRGDGDFERFGRYADALLEEREFFIRKAIGWVLRDTARKRPTLVADWLRPRVQRASGVTLREALKPLPPETRDQLLAGRAPAPRRGGGSGRGLTASGRANEG